MPGHPNITGTETPAGAGEAPSALDLPTLAQLEQLDPTGTSHIVQRVLETYQRSLVKAMADFAAARAAADMPVLMRIAHTLRSSSASVGALVLSGCCRAVELHIRDGQLEGIDPLLQELQNESERVQAAVADMLVGKGASQ